MIQLVKRVRDRLAPEADPDKELLDTVAPYTLCSPGKLKTLRQLARSLNLRSVEGDFVECGAFKGGSAAVIATELTPSRHLYLYDSFMGMPPVRDVDGEEAKKHVAKVVGSEEAVVDVLARVGAAETSYTIRKGWFEQSFKEPLPAKVALLHCDADWYDSVSLVLETFYPLVPEGGCVVLDDFGWWEGCREAFYDFCFRHGEKPLLERVELDQAYWIKGRRHNR